MTLVINWPRVLSSFKPSYFDSTTCVVFRGKRATHANVISRWFWSCFNRLISAPISPIPQERSILSTISCAFRPLSRGCLRLGCTLIECSPNKKNSCLLITFQRFSWFRDCMAILSFGFVGRANLRTRVRWNVARESEIAYFIFNVNTRFAGVVTRALIARDACNRSC